MWLIGELKLSCKKYVMFSKIAEYDRHNIEEIFESLVFTVVNRKTEILM